MRCDIPAFFTLYNKKYLLYEANKRMQDAKNSVISRTFSKKKKVDLIDNYRK
mgnify:CR=1 FL=1